MRQNRDDLLQSAPPGLRPTARALEAIERRVASAGKFGLSSNTDIPLGTIATCPTCGQERIRSATIPNATGRSLQYWTECACVVQAADRAVAISRDAQAAIRGSRDEAGDAPGAYDIAALEKSGALALGAFDPGLLADRSPYDAAVRWLFDIRDRQVVGSYRDGPPAALYIVGERGRGKTHLAVGLLLEARRHGHRVALLNEKKYLHQSRTVPFGPPLESLVAEPGERAFLSVFDDIGKHRAETEQARAAVVNAWYSVLDRRYNARRWSVFTSEKTIDELADGGTLDDALYSRLYEMTRGVQLRLEGADQRLGGRP